MSDPSLNTALQRVPPANGGRSIALGQPYELQMALDPVSDKPLDSTLTLADLLHIVLKHKWTLLLVILVATSVSVVRTLLSTPTYRSTVTMQIERAPQRVVNFNDPDAEQAYASDESVVLKTQYELLKSRSLAERVIDDLRLDRAASARPSTAAPAAPTAASAAAPAPSAAEATDFLGRVIGGYNKLTTPAIKDGEILNRDGIIGGFLGALTVEPVRSSRLIRVHVDNTDPELASRIANATVQTFITMNLERRMEASTYAKTFLEDQIAQVKARLEDSERKLNQYAKSKEIVTLDDKTNVVNQTYTDYASALARAEQERIKFEAAFGEISRNPDSAPQVMENKTIQAFKDNRAKLEIEYQQNLSIFKPDYPKMLQLRAQIEKSEAQIKAETQAVRAALRSQFEAAQQQESLLRDKLSQTRRQVQSTQDSSIDLNMLKREVETNRQLYDGLLQRLKQVNVVGGMTSNNISVVDKAEPALFPYKPDLRRNFMVGLAIGVILGLGLVFVIEYLDDSIKLPEEVERTLAVPLMGIVPLVARKRENAYSVAYDVHTEPRSALAEAYRSLRTALQFATSEGAPKRLLVTSTTRDEGKSTTALALAINFAQMGQKVLLVDADMRNPSVHKQLGIANDAGLSNLLSGEFAAESLLQETDIPNLHVLTAGPLPPNPVDLLLGPKLLATIEYATMRGMTHVIVDAPPLLGIADSVVLANQIQDVLFVIHAGSTRKGQIRDALRRLRVTGIVPRGVVLTQVTRSTTQHHYESYYGYGSSDGRRKPAAGTPAA